ncbi:hypothetical protein LTR35_000639 [Friedmanniomyces endolithicus]|uniref:Uncharacterized protein n=1 Tax=Friedmanniomyces endolithicus TaxID=329885 RepID=A0AAN6F6K9_9PEZI|nr:hypothetical protein LTS00_012158 [Friedmanniomyces endolithicus]KAK0292608.1 hypothetical protein LTR35_000639 [Friedmanniomyces endolithicus]KAK0303825.1 hypothetical protein LTR82_017432 [Friedmanniomyces endolithicus]KAK1007653.1 hypothetical protein LTR54_006379 [Friedmanniomyces endolithicus]
MDSAIIRASLTAATLSGMSNCLAQCITCFRSNSQIQSTSDLPTILATFVSAVQNDFDPKDTLRYVLFSLLVCPPNYLWQKWLEGRFPGYITEEAAGKEKMSDEHGVGIGRDTGAGSMKKRMGNGGTSEKDATTESPTPPNPAKAGRKAKQKLNMTNTSIKFLLDQTLGAAVNTVIFIAGIALLRGASPDSLGQKVQEGFWPLIRAGQKLWPMVSVAQFTVVPFEWRTLVGSCVGLVWGVIVSLMSSPGGKGKVE